MNHAGNWTSELFKELILYLYCKLLFFYISFYYMIIMHMLLFKIMTYCWKNNPHKGKPHLVEFPCHLSHIILLPPVLEVQSVDGQDLPLSPSPLISTKIRSYMWKKPQIHLNFRYIISVLIPFKEVCVRACPLKAVTKPRVTTELLRAWKKRHEYT